MVPVGTERVDGLTSHAGGKCTCLGMTAEWATVGGGDREGSLG